MLLKRLELKRFRKFSHQVISFAPGLNIICGPNESGKSTLRTALTTVLFGNPTSTSELTRELTTWGGGEKFELRLDYVDENNMECNLRKDFAGKKIFLIKGEESLRTFKSIQASIVGTLGIPSEDLFRLCASLDVRTLGNLGTQVERRQVNKMLAGMITGTDTGGDVLQALKKLKDTLALLGKGIRGQAVKTPGPIKGNRDRLLQLKSQQKQLQATLASHREKSNEHNQIEQAVENSEKRGADLDHLLSSNKKIMESEKRRNELVALETELENQDKTRKDAEKELHEIETKMVSFSFGAWGDADSERLRQLELEIAQCAGQIKNHAKPEKSNGKYFFVLGGIAVFVGLILFLYQWIPALMFLLAGSGIMLGGTMKQKKIRTQAQKELEGLQEKEGALASLQHECADCISKTGYQSSEEIFQEWPKYRELQIKKNAWAQRLQAQMPVDAVRWQTVRRELRMTEDMLGENDLMTLKLSAQDAAAFQREFDDLLNRRQVLTDKKRQLKVLLDHEQTHQDDLYNVEEEIDAVTETLQRLESQEQLFEKTHALLDRARRDTLNPARKVLEERAGEFMAVFSQKRYTNIAVDDEDLSCKILIPETGTWENPQVLSQGTYDQFYLSLRFALSEVLTDGKPAPIFLDEPLAAFDEHRVQATLEMLKLVAKKRQILFFTCKQDYHAAADHVVDLSLA
ncbi:AAA family ATPase [bacterium]|nr:AAA family ATPase [bacterium]